MERAWLDALYTLTGVDGATLDTALGRSMIKDTAQRYPEHKDAVWLNKTLSRCGDNIHKHQAHQVIEEAAVDEPTPGLASFVLYGLCHVADIANRHLATSISLGCVYAQAFSTTRQVLEEAANIKGNRNALYELSLPRNSGDSLVRKCLLYKAAKLGSPAACLAYLGQYNNVYDDDEVVEFAQCVIRLKMGMSHHGWHVLREFCHAKKLRQMFAFGRFFSEAPVSPLYDAGCKCGKCQNMDIFKTTIGTNHSMYVHIADCMALYERTTTKARAAAIAWVLCAKRMASSAGHPFCKDIRTKIARLVWSIMMDPTAEEEEEHPCKKK